MNRKHLLAGLGAAVLMGGCSCTYVSPDASNFTCAYKGGPFDSKGFDQAVAPGSGRTSINHLGNGIDVPVNVRQYDNSDGLPDVTVNVRGVPLTFRPSLTFTISSVKDEEGKPAGCDLIEQHLRPLGATDFNSDVANSAWVKEFLNVRVGPVVRDVAPRVLQGLDPTALAFNTDNARDEAADAFGEVLTTTLAQQLGGAYFCSPSFRYGGTAEQCGSISVVLPEPGMQDTDRQLLAAPQRARTEANNAIAVATEEARQANEIAGQLEQQATSADRAADAREDLANAEARVVEVEGNTAAQRDYAWCEYLVSLGQDCALVKAAENGEFPMIFGQDVPVTALIPAESSE